MADTPKRRGPKPAGERLRRLLVMLPWLMERGSVSVAEMAAHFRVSESELVSDLTLASLCGIGAAPACPTVAGWTAAYTTSCARQIIHFVRGWDVLDQDGDACAGPGNPPVLVDGTGCLKKAARDVIQGGGFDNNLLCIGEKQVFVLEQHVGKFLEALKGAGAVQLNAQQLDKLAAEAFTFTKDAGGCSHPAVNRKYVGADAAVLAKVAGASAPAETPILFAQTDVENLFVMEEQMMPMIPVVAVKSIEQGIDFAKKSEHGYKHSAIIHSLNVDHMTQMARALDTTLFVKNGPSVAGLGLGGEGYLSYSIATTTGEGITTPSTFTRGLSSRVSRCSGRQNSLTILKSIWPLPTGWWSLPVVSTSWRWKPIVRAANFCRCSRWCSRPASSLILAWPVSCQ